MSALASRLRVVLAGFLAFTALSTARPGAAQVGQWTWQKGASDSSPASGAGVYGDVTVPAAVNVPGARSESASWRDAAGNAWLFGGQGYAAAGSGLLNDLWRWDGTAWTWMSGSNAVDAPGTYGTIGQASPSNTPGARTGAVSWTDLSGSLWLFGGYGRSASASGFLNDLWKWDGSAWTWVSGSSGVNQPGVYGEKGTPSAGNAPGAREKATAWRDAGGNLWLFGGYGHAASGSGYLNDLWKWNGSAWTWVSGSNAPYPNAFYGTPGVPAPGNAPGGRQDGVSWVDAAGNLWLFGGYGATVGFGGDLNDLWKFDGSAWTHLGGPAEPMRPGIYGGKGSTSPSSWPGARENAVSWVDAAGNLWLHGGYGYSASGFGRLNDLWQWNGRHWTWVSGGAGIDAQGVYGAQGSPAPANVPGSRVDAASWIDGAGKLWLLGGSGIDGAGAAGHLGDLWSFVPPLIPSLSPIGTPIVVGETKVLSGSGFTAGSVVKLYVATSTGASAHGPFTPTAWTPTSLTWDLPASIALGNGFGTVQVVNTDQGYTESNLEGQLLYGDALDNIPTITSVNGVALNPPDISTPVANVSTVVVPGMTVALGGTGFQNDPKVNLYTAEGNVGPLTPLAGWTSTSLTVNMPAQAPVGPGSFQVVNGPYTGNVLSNAVSAPIWTLVTITGVTVAGNTVTVNGTGFCSLSVINLFNKQGEAVVNLGGVNPDGSPKIPLTIVASTQLTFQKPAGAVAGPSFVQVLNPPFIPYSSSGNDPDGAFTMP